jgi:hypothetical protein
MMIGSERATEKQTVLLSIQGDQVASTNNNHLVWIVTKLCCSPSTLRSFIALDRLQTMVTSRSPPQPPDAVVAAAAAVASMRQHLRALCRQKMLPDCSSCLLLVLERKQPQQMVVVAPAVETLVVAAAAAASAAPPGLGLGLVVAVAPR